MMRISGFVLRRWTRRFMFKVRRMPTRRSSGSIAYTNDVETALFKIGFCLPAGPYVTDDDVRYIVDCIKEAIR